MIHYESSRGHKIDGTKPKSNRKLEISRESRQKRTDKKVASKGHRRDKHKIKIKIKNTNKITQTVETN